MVMGEGGVVVRLPGCGCSETGDGFASLKR